MGVGSYASPGWFVAANAQIREGKWGADDVAELFEDATRIAIADQIEAGLDVITDGELRRQRFVFEMFGHLAGLKRVPGGRRLGIAGYDMAPKFAVEGDIAAPSGLHVVEEFRQLQRLAPGRRLKVALPGPVTFAGFLLADGRDPATVIEQLIAVIRGELERLIAAGADYIQLDEPGIAKGRLGLSVMDAADAINRTLAGLPARRAVHVCFGNNAGRPMADRRLAPLMDAMEALDCEELALEFANREMSEVAALGTLGRKFDIAAGVIDVKNFRLEEPDEVADKLDLCLAHIAPQRLAATADCGFSALPRYLARQKMQALVAGAAVARRRHGLA